MRRAAIFCIFVFCIFCMRDPVSHCMVGKSQHLITV